MTCKNCSNQLPAGAKFCNKCGAEVKANSTKDSLFTTGVVLVEQDHSVNAGEVIIKCGSCGYVGPGEKNRSLGATILAWLCVCFAPLITIIYFIATHKYRCQKCKSTFLGIKNKDGVFTGQSGGAARGVMIVIVILIGIAIIGILSSVVLASLSTARQKSVDTLVKANNTTAGVNWSTYSSPKDNFSALFPRTPTLDSKEDLPVSNSGGAKYSWHSYESEDNGTSYYVFKYIYSTGLDASNPDKVLKVFLNNTLNSIEAGRLVSSGYIYHGTNRALDFQISSGKEVIKGRYVLVGEDLYLIMVDYFPESYNVENYNKFINSFRTL